MTLIDSKGRKWEPEVNVVTIGRVRERLKINLLELIVPDNKLAERFADPCLIVDVLYLLCKDAADTLGINDVEFGKSMTPDAIEEGWDGVLQGVVNFSPRGLRPANQKILDKAKTLREAGAKQIQSLIDSPAFDALLDTAMTKAANSPITSPSETTGIVTSLPESSASSPAETPSPA